MFVKFLKWKLALAVSIVVFASIFFYKQLDFKYFTLYCSIYTRDASLIFNKQGFGNCDFSHDGYLLASNIIETTLWDQNDNIVWQSAEHSHHQPKFAKDGKSFIYMNSEVAEYLGEQTLDNCVIIRDLQGNLKHKWCISKNFDELKEAGIVFGPPNVRGHINGGDAFPNVKYEISHMNSVYEIGKNSLSSANPAFEEGNFIVNLHSPTEGVVILDKDLKHILWAIMFRSIKYETDIYDLKTHDVQVTEQGDLLIYVNRMNRTGSNDFKSQKGPNVFSGLMEIDPLNGKIIWSYFDEPKENFYSKVQGSVEILKNGNYLYSTDGSAFEVTSWGRKVWSFTHPEKDRDGLPVKFLQIKSMYDISFLEKRNLL